MPNHWFDPAFLSPDGIETRVEIEWVREKWSFSAKKTEEEQEPGTVSARTTDRKNILIIAPGTGGAGFCFILISVVPCIDGELSFDTSLALTPARD